MEAKRALALNPKDNVAVALENIRAGETIAVRTKGGEPRSVLAAGNIPFAFKVALVDIPERQAILKYGETIGRATRNIQAGEQVHVHNIEGLRVQKGAGAKKGETA